jgi:outer membrane scaffolding protein for murein synthesis (MipA/OmpV family)
MRSGMHRAVLGGGLAVLLLAANVALADEISPYSILNLSSQPAITPDWIVTLGAGLQYGPSYEGASKTGFSVVPSDFDIRRPGEPAGFSAPDDAFSYTLFDAHGFSFGPAADYRGGRSRSDERDLAGLHSIPPTLDAGAFAEYWLIENRLRAHVELRQALRGRQGLVADLAADWVQPVEAFTFSLGPRLSAGNGTYMRSSFGISADEAAVNSLVTPYRPNAGITSVGALASISYQFTPSWKATIYDKYDRLVGDAADSPITARIGSPNQNTVGIDLSYSFGVKF